MKKLPKAIIKRLKPYWLKLERLEYEFLKKVDNLEKDMQKEIGINYLEFYCDDFGYSGIGNDSRTIKLIHGEQLRKIK